MIDKKMKKLKDKRIKRNEENQEVKEYESEGGAKEMEFLLTIFSFGNNNKRGSLVISCRPH